MSEALGELLRRSADAAREPRLDVGELVAQATRRQRHRRMALAAVAAVVVGAVALGSFAFRNDPAAEPDPAPSPSPTGVDARPFVYGSGETVHVGDESFDAGAPWCSSDVTDDGVVYMTEGDNRLWFHDGSTAEAIGRVPTDVPGGAYVETANPGSLVVWTDAASPSGKGPDYHPTDRVVYDTSQRAVVGRLGEAEYAEILHVDESHVFYVPLRGPHCWLMDVQDCTDPQVLRHDVESGDTQRISKAEFEDELSTQGRMLVLAEDWGADTNTAFSSRQSGFKLDGRRLVPTDGWGNDTVFTRMSGEPVELQVPAVYTPPRPDFEVVQWLDDDRLVLAGGRWVREYSWPDLADLLVCSLSAGECEVAVHTSTYIVPAG